MFNKKRFFLFLTSLVFLVPNAVAFAQIVPCGRGDSPTDACTLCHFIVGFKNLIDFGLGLLITVAVVGIFISGVMYIVSSGSEQLITKAKTFLSASLVGFAVVLGAWLLVNVVMWAISFDPAMSIQKASWYDFECVTSSEMI